MFGSEAAYDVATRAQAVRAAEEAATQAEGAAQAAEAGGNAVEATSKAALASLRCSQVRSLQPPHMHAGRAQAGHAASEAAVMHPQRRDYVSTIKTT